MLLDYTSFSSLFFYYNVYYPCPPIWRSPIFPLRVCTPGIRSPSPKNFNISSRRTCCPSVRPAAARLWEKYLQVQVTGSGLFRRRRRPPYRHAGAIAICEKIKKFVWGLKIFSQVAPITHWYYLNPNYEKSIKYTNLLWDCRL